ncbi:MAG: fumarylacetoacetate hydrolase family protein [Deltaproteobacteria bacterium]|nr:fumarylacetoacetate hydrolase family protein [Deltaproteobacteria bacterium]
MGEARRRLVRYRVHGTVGRAELSSDGSLRVLEGPPATSLDEVALLPPVLPTKIVGIGLNYRAHAQEMGKPLPAEPLMFLKPPSALVASGEPIVRPAGDYARVDYEGELAVVIGRPARRVRREQALEFVAGYTCLNDVTVRDLQVRDVQYTRAKGFDSFCPLGPCLAEGLDPSDLALVTRVDGVVRQASRTSDLIFDVPTLIEAVSRVMTLLPGDVISTGTPPGVGNLEPGQTVEIEIEGIGILKNRVIAEESP